MSARKPIARMDLLATTDPIDDAPLEIAIAVVAEAIASKTEQTANGDKIESSAKTENCCEEKTEETIKEENKTPDEGESLETQESENETSTVTTLGTDAKRQTRNSPMLIGSPIKKKINESQEQDCSTESTSTVDEPQKTQKNEKAPFGRLRKFAVETTNQASISPSNRVTRKTAAQDWAANTRLTRARRTSVGMSPRPDTPPKRKCAQKKNIDPPATAVKRKRSVSPKLSGEEPEVKCTKPEEPDGDFELNSVVVKQEILESSEEMISDVASDITEPFPPEPTSRISLRTRKSATCYSPTTRAYRRDKDKDKTGSEAGTLDAKRKRPNRVRPDEDSKDSLGSSIMDEVGDIKSEEKFESEDACDITNSSAIETMANGAVDKPLTVETELEVPLATENEVKAEEAQVASTSEVTSEKLSFSDKAASLSPDLISEGVSEISVKRFYKKPEFLENNLGIEKDPKLGEIVQNVAEKIEDVDQLSVSNESIKEGELVFEEEEVASIGSIKNDNDNDEDANSVSTGYISPLLVDDEEDEEGTHMPMNGDVEDEKCDEKSNADEMKLTKDIELEADVLGEEAVEAPNEVPDSNGSLGIKIDRVYENVKFEACDKTVGDIEEKDISNEMENVKDVVPVETVTEETEPEKLELPEKKEFNEEKPEKTKVEDMKTEEIETDKEENKENVQLLTEIVKVIDQETANTTEKDHITSKTLDGKDDSTTNSLKNQGEISGDGSTPSTSPQSAKSSSITRTPENDDRLRQKERHFKTLGLLTHKAADEAIMAKQKRRKFLHNLNGGSKKNTSTSNAAANAGPAAGNAQNKSSHEYTGTLKTVIKLNRQSGGSGSGVGGISAAVGNGGASEAKRGKNTEVGTKAATSGYGSRRQSLKMTFQKGRGRPSNAEKSGEHPANISGEDSYYTIQNEGEGATASATEASTTATATAPATTPSTTTTTHSRKSYNRSNTTNDATHHAENSEASSTSKKDEKEEILIPEKASSFKFHPGRLCQDQCYYCSGKFGLYDTPCHVGQIKSVERQQKILENEEKLTVDNCLCDACFRHVDRRANVPSYKKRLSASAHTDPAKTSTNVEDTSNEQEKSQQQKTSQTVQSNGSATSAVHLCAVPGCGQNAPHSLRRKGIRKSVKKLVLNFDMSTAGTYLHLCEKHYEAVVQSSGCVLCKRRLGKNNMYHITTDTDKLEKALADMGIPVSLGQGNAVCKLCRYFANLLMKPPENGKVQKVEFVKNYKKRLLQFYNIHEKKDSSHEEDEPDDDKPKEKSPTKKQITPPAKRVTRKSLEPTDDSEEPMETTECPPSPTPSSGSSVEMISDGGVFDDSLQRTANTSSLVTADATDTAANTSNQMVLDNDVMVDYDVPTISDSSSSGSSKSTSPSPQRRRESKDQQSKLKAILQSVGTSLEDRSDISNVLRSNPNISMRELFPGEEDLGLQFKAPFGSSSAQRTPEGWTRVNTFLQYDEPTRRLWEDLQKPYGNQSSFLRHLILLEKYYRNGDLILSSSASSNATVYTQTVRNRLTSFDSRGSASSSPTKDLESRSRSLSVDKIQRQLSSNSVTITARPKAQKAQQKDEEISQQKDVGSTAGCSSTGLKSTANSRSILKTNHLLPVKGGAVEIVPLSASNSTSNSPHSSSGTSTPNESVLLTKQQKILAAANKLMSNKQETPTSQKKSLLNTTPPDLISLNRKPVNTLSTQQVKRPQLLPKPMNSGKPIPPNVIVLPDTLTSQERLESKSWRPTLLPVTTTSHHLNNQQGPLYQTADGRRLPALVQVQSGGRPFLISIHDYNRMCILRREKLMRDQMLKGSKGKLKGIFPPATCSSNTSGKSSTSNALQSFNKTMQAVASSDNMAKKQRLIMNKTAIFTPIAPKPTQTTTSVTTSPPSTVTSTAAQQQQSQVQPTVILPAGTLQPISILSTSQPSTLSTVPIFGGQVVPIINPSTSTATTTGIPTNSWLWNNFPDSNQMLMNGSGNSTSTKEPQTPTGLTSMKQQHSLLMSKIPKSLTVIPQHKLMPASTAGTSNLVGNTPKE